MVHRIHQKGQKMNSISEEDILLKRKCEKVINPLRCIFWGGIFVVIDFNLTCRSGNRIVGVDLFNDSLGLILITIGLLFLMSIDHTEKYDYIISFTSVIFLIICIGSISFSINPSLREKLNNPILLFWFLESAGILLFCWSLKLLFDDEKMKFLNDRWDTLMILFLLLSIIPNGIFIILNKFNIFNTNILIAILMKTLLEIVPFVYLFLTINKIIEFAKSKIPNLDLVM
jgi:hypothetical protein